MGPRWASSEIVLMEPTASMTRNHGLKKEQHRDGSRRYWDRAFIRTLSFLLAAGVSVLILVYPRFIAAAPGEIRHGLLTLMMWGVAAGFVHGVGYVPRLKLWRYLLGPLVGIPVMLAAIIWLVWNL
jgi:cyd operon protein YbgE